MTPHLWQILVRALSIVLVAGSVFAIAAITLFAWGFTDSRSWGSWGKPQTHAEHVTAFWTFLMRHEAFPLAFSFLGVIAGIALWCLVGPIKNHGSTSEIIRS